MPVRSIYLIILTQFFSVLLFGKARAQDYQLVSTLTDNDGPVTVLLHHPGLNLVINGDETGKIYFRDAITGQLKRKIQSNASSIDVLSLNSNGRLMIIASGDGELKVFDFHKDAIIQSIYSPDYSGINFALFSIADGFIYFNSGGRMFKTRSDLTQKVSLVFQEELPISDAVISRDRGSVIYSTGNSLKVMNTRTDQLHQEFTIGNSPIHAIKWLNDSVLVSWAEDGTLSCWPFSLGQLDTTPSMWMKAGQPGPFSFNKNGTRMLSGNVGNWARIWNPEKKEVLQELFGHKSTVTSAVFGAGDALIFTGSKDGTIRLWKSSSIPEPEPPVIITFEDLPSDLADTLSTVVTQNDSSKNDNGYFIGAVELQPEPITATDSVPLVRMAEDNKPTMIGGREVRQAGTIEINTAEVTIYVFDNSYIDGDTMSLYFNDEWILDHYGVTKSKKPIQLSFKENTNNYLVLFANNLGKTPPNTAAIQFFDGKTDRLFKLSSDLNTCSALNFVYKKE